MARSYQDLVDEVSALLGAPATLEDREFALIAFCAHDAAALDPVRTSSILSRRSSAAVRAWFEGHGITRATGPLRTPRDPQNGWLGRLCLPVRHDGIGYGYLWLLDDGATPLDDPRLTEAMRLADRAGELLAAEVRAAARPARAFARLLSDSPRERAKGAQALADSGPIAVAVLPPGCTAPGLITHRTPGGVALLVPLLDPANTTPARTAATRALTGQPHPPSRTPRRPNGGPPEATPAWAADTGTGAEGRVAGGGVAGVGGGREGVAGARESWLEARAARRVGLAWPERGPVVCWDGLGAYRVVAGLAAEPDPVVRALLEPGNEPLLQTAEVFLDNAGHAQRTAAALSVHRQTLYYRLSRIEALTGLDLDQGDDRLLLHLAVKTVRLARVPDDG